MKKSNFLRSSKEMLTKSFNSAKCKTSLKLASSRLKLLRNKKEVQVKQMKRELAQLLDSGQDRTARIRVEHVVREEKMMAAYDLIEIYCELIVARLPIIESQKNCPIDLKEAITSVVFASPRCGDIPELVDVRKHFTAKYGKEFISAAVELRPDCGVSRMLVEKLSAKAPDGQTKIKILGAIAEEHGVKWDAKSVEEAELVPPNDLLNGSGSLQKVDPPQFEDSDARIPLDHSQRHNAFLKSGEQNGRSSLGSQNCVSAHPVSSSGFHDERSEARQSYPGDGNFSVGRQNWNMEFKDATSAAQAAAESAERASLAARAAAELSRVTRQYSSESERSEIQSSGGGGPGMYDTSSIHEHFPKNSSTSSLPDRNPRFQKERVDGLRHDNLARATRQFQDDSHGTSGGGRPGNYGTSSIHEHFPKDLGTSSSPGRNSSFQKERMDDLRHNNLVTAARHCNDSHGTSNRPQSKVSAGGTGSISNNNSYASFEEGDRCMQESLSEEDNRDKMAMRKPSVRTEAELINNFKNDSTEDFNYFGEETTTKDPKLNSSNSCLSTSVVGENTPYSSHQSVGYDATNDPFNGGYQGHVPSESVNKTSHDFASVAFDDSSSEDNDNIKFDSDPVYDGQQAKLYFPSPERKSPTLDAASKHSWSFDSDKSLEKFPLSSEIFVERHSDISSESLLTTGDNSRPQNAVPTFDDSDDMNSGSDSEMVHTSIGRSKDFQDVFYEHSQNYDSPGSSNKGNVSGTDGKKWSHTSDKLLSDDVHKHGKSDSISFSSDDEAKHTKPQDGKDDAGTPIDDGSLDSSGFGFEEEFKFGKLTGGLKHKGHIPPPYTRSQLNNVSSSVERLKGSPVVMSQAVSPRKNSIGLGVRMKTDDKSSSRLEDAHSASDSDSSEEEFSRETSSYRQRTHAQKTGGEVNTKYAGLRGSTTYFDSDSSDSEIGPKKQSLAARSQLGSGFSRRTKASSSSLDTSSSSKYKRSSVAAVASDTGIDKKSTRSTSGADTQEPKKPLVHSYVADTQEQQRLTRNSYSNETHESPSHRRVSSKQPGVGLAASNLSSQPNMVAHEGRLKSGRVEQPAKMGAASGSNDAPRAPASSDNKFSREDSMNKASHVHPKLPDYDDIAAKLQSLRMNNK